MSPDASKARILVVDDEAAVRTLLRRLLTMQSYDVIEAEDGPTALTLLRSERPDMVLLDVSLPVQDGLDVLANVRRESEVPVILVTARSDESDRVVGLRMGADDYVVKPFSSAELSARIESVLRRSRVRSSARSGARLTFGTLEIDVETREVCIEGEVVTTTAREFDLLVTDVVMPRVNGVELAKRMHIDHPEIPVLFVSGYADTATREDLRGAEVLIKPFLLRELTAKVREVLDRAARRTEDEVPRYSSKR
jgi:two-component system alkaline phosphatase synthesis response regulator PhoP